MDHECDIVKFGPVTLAVSETFLMQSEIPERINAQFDAVYDWAGESKVDPAGQNHAIYDQFGPEGMRMRVGFPVAKAFADGDRVKCLRLPAVKAAHLRHCGSYDELGDVHAALNEWCANQSFDRAKVSWEVYGDWHDDPSELVTDVYIQIG